MAEAIVFDLTFGILGHLGSTAYKEITQLWGLDTNLEKLEDTLSTIQGVLYDAESKACHSEGVKIWLNRLQDAIFDADDILDEFRTEARAAMRRQSKATNTKAKLCLFFAGSKQLILRSRISRQIQKIRETMDEIKGDSIFVTLSISGRENPVPISHLRETHSYVRIEEVIGRDVEKKVITKFLLECDENFSVLPIVGYGGIGKTTIAQYVFNDKEVQKHFELKLWVCVSDVFDLKMIIENILLSASVYSQDSKEYMTYVEKLKFLNLEQLQIKLRGELENKRYLLVLDDLWNDNRYKWLELEFLLKDGAKGSIVMVTTRSMLVSQITSTTSPYELNALGVDQSWSLFKQVAFKPGQEEMISPRILEIGKEIALKCRGVPLALKTIGSLMYSKPHDQWLSFKDRELANIAQGEDAIMQTLKLSYDHLPSHLKHCFAYSSLYPKDYEIHVPDMVKLWVAQGFVQSSNETDFLEYIGYEYYEVLVGRYFFKQVTKNTRTTIWSCTLHDLMHDLATQVSGRNSILLNDKNAADCHRKLRHVSLDFHKLNVSSKFSQMLFHAEKVRSFIQLEEVQFASAKDLKWSNLDVIFSNMKRLRVLKLQCLQLEKLPSSLRNLIHLRYLGLRRSSIEKLPRSVSRLRNLETLDLDGCRHLSEYPPDLNKFMNLKFIYNFSVPAFLPQGFEELTSLQFLDWFYMADNNSRNAAGLAELKNLNNLGRWLAIGNIGHGKEAATECQAANLKEKRHIKNLDLHWKVLEGVEADEDMILNDGMSLEGLQPHPNLKILIIVSYNGTGLPRWLPTLTNLTQLELIECRTCKYVPSMLHQLPCLEILVFYYADSLEYAFFHEEVLSSRPSSFFPSLNELRIEFCSSFKGWVRSNRNSDGLDYPIVDDQAILWPAFPSLSSLSLEGYLDGVFFPPFPSLERLRFISTSHCQLERTIKMMSEHASSTSTFKTLFIADISDLLLLPEEICNFSSLCSIEICGCHNLKSLPQEIKNLSSLEILQLERCPELATIPEGLVNLSCLKELKIRNCPLLSHRYNRDTGEDWSKISHIPNVDIH